MPAPGFRDTIAVKRTGGYDTADRPLWRMAEPLLFYSVRFGCWLLVPAGFITNYASVPRLPFVYWYCGDRVYEEPGLHDFLYTAHCIYVVEIDGSTGAPTSEPVLRQITKEEADDVFLEALLLNPKIPDGMAHAMHLGVRLGGARSWSDTSSIVQPEHIQELVRFGAKAERAREVHERLDAMGEIR